MTFALVDCNNFYASCEKLFRPDLKDTPVLVLSNNDGCIVARSREAKALGFPMGAPIFKFRDLVRDHGVVTFSSNYALYADISSRVMRTLGELAPVCEVYSIDEAFLDLSGVSACIDLVEFGQQIRQTISQWIGITVCVGIAPTKTLAKLANHAAKRYPATGGVVDLSDRYRQRRLLTLTPVSEVWGIGSKLAARLGALGITTALELAEANPALLRKRLSVVVERTVNELNGVSCIELEDAPPPKKQIICSRSFGERITCFQNMRGAVCEYASRAAEKLRREKQRASVITVFIQTGKFSKGEPYYSNAATGKLPFPSDDTRDFIELARVLLERIWRDGYRYLKAGVMLCDFSPPGVCQRHLFEEDEGRRGSVELMETLDKLNRGTGGVVWFAGQGIQQPWGMKRGRLSPAYTTNWNKLPLAH
ncbi:translesion error-prone DNA polymerase V subunit UmuC [Hahella sp. NBU794]|uniref:translesion error-prone DNA polymerase V subunit UmuC n=1 Tax=Hahella sp. NBU794 TaxID=3422590 RepID=UPI003D6F4B71